MGWRQLWSIRDANVEARQQELAEPPKACPFDGTPLQQGPDGMLLSERPPQREGMAGIRFCPLGDYQWPRDGRLL